MFPSLTLYLLRLDSGSGNVSENSFLSVSTATPKLQYNWRSSDGLK